MIDLLVILALLAGVVLFVSAPLRRPGTTERLADGPEVRELEAARDAKLRELSDAELDHRTGKLSDEDFEGIDAGLRREAIQILRELDEAREVSGAAADLHPASIRD